MIAAATPLQPQPGVAAPGEVGARLTAISLAFEALAAGRAVNLAGLPAALATVLAWARGRSPAGVDDAMGWHMNRYAAAGGATLVGRSAAHELIISLDADGAPCIAMWRSLAPGAASASECFQFERDANGAQLLFEVEGVPQQRTLPQPDALAWGSLSGHAQRLAREAAPATVAPAPVPAPAVFCEQCGQRLGPQARFCSGCGTKVPAETGGAPLR